LRGCMVDPGDKRPPPRAEVEMLEAQHGASSAKHASEVRL
jgi:hypothetical protein